MVMYKHKYINIKAASEHIVVVCFKVCQFNCELDEGEEKIM